MGLEARGSMEPEEGASGLGATVGEATEATETGEATGPQGKGGRWVAEGMEEVVREVTEVDTEVDTETVGARLVGPRGLEATVGEAWGSSRGLEQAGGRWWVHPGMQLRRKLRG